MNKPLIIWAGFVLGVVLFAFERGNYQWIAGYVFCTVTFLIANELRTLPMFEKRKRGDQ